MHCVLVVEDNEDDQFFLLRAVKRSDIDLADIHFVFKEDGESALAWIQKNGCPDLVITDNEMVPMGGIQLVSLLTQQEELPAVPIAMWTDHVDDPGLVSIKENLVSLFHKKNCEKLTSWIESVVQAYVL